MLGRSGVAVLRGSSTSSASTVVFNIVHKLRLLKRSNSVVCGLSLSRLFVLVCNKLPSLVRIFIMGATILRICGLKFGKKWLRQEFSGPLNCEFVILFDCSFDGGLKVCDARSRHYRKRAVYGTRICVNLVLGLLIEDENNNGSV